MTIAAVGKAMALRPLRYCLDHLVFIHENWGNYLTLGVALGRVRWPENPWGSPQTLGVFIFKMFIDCFRGVAWGGISG